MFPLTVAAWGYRQ